MRWLKYFKEEIKLFYFFILLETYFFLILKILFFQIGIFLYGNTFENLNLLKNNLKFQRTKIRKNRLTRKSKTFFSESISTFVRQRKFFKKQQTFEFLTNIFLSFFFLSIFHSFSFAKHIISEIVVCMFFKVQYSFFHFHTNSFDVSFCFGFDRRALIIAWELWYPIQPRPKTRHGGLNFCAESRSK